MNFRKIRKKAMLESTLGKVIFGAVLIVVLIGLVMLFGGKLKGIFGTMAKALRFG